MLHHAGNAGEALSQRHGVGNGAKPRVEDEVASIRDENVAVFHPQRDLPRQAERCRRGKHGSARRLQPERHHLDRQREAAERGDDLAAVGDHHHRRGGAGDDLLTQQRPAAALDQGEVRPDLVGAVDGEVELGLLVERRQRDAEPLGQRPGGLGGRHAAHGKAGAHPRAQQLDEDVGGRAGAEAEPHAGPHLVEGARGSGALQGFAAGHVCPPRGPFGRPFPARALAWAAGHGHGRAGQAGGEPR